MNLFIYALAVWRIGRMIVHEQGPWRAFLRLRTALDENAAPWVAEGIHCFSCTSFWVALAMMVVPPRIRLVLAAAGAAKLVDDYFYGAEPENVSPFDSYLHSKG